MNKFTHKSMEILSKICYPALVLLWVLAIHEAWTIDAYWGKAATTATITFAIVMFSLDKLDQQSQRRGYQ